jgi:hypothetical protein
VTDNQGTRARKPKFRRIGWAGVVIGIGGNPSFDSVNDTYCEGGEHVFVCEVFKSKTQARKRFQGIREVFVRE